MNLIDNVSIKEKFYDYSKKTGYAILENQSLIPENDPTIYLINSTVALFKNQMNKSLYIKDTALIQDCFRNNSDVNSFISLYFKMMGHVGMKTSLSKILNDILFLFQTCFCMELSKIHCYVHQNDQDLIDCWNENGLSSNLIFINELTPEYSTNWNYGDVYNLEGRGMTLAYHEPQSESPWIRKISLGNVIVVKNTVTNLEYVETGFGLDKLISFHYEYDIFQIPSNRILIQKIMNLEIGKDDAKVLSLLLKGIFKLFDEGVFPSNKKSGYLLKSTIKKLIRKLLSINGYQINSLISLYSEIFKSIEEVESMFKTDHHDLVVIELKKFVLNSEKNEQAAINFIQKNKLLNTIQLKKKTIETFGLLPHKVEQMFENEIHKEIN